MTVPGKSMRQWVGRTWKLQRRPFRGSWKTVEAFDTEQQAKQVMRAIFLEPGFELKVAAPDGETVARRKWRIL